MKRLLAALFALFLAFGAWAQVGGPVIGQATGLNGSGTLPASAFPLLGPDGANNADTYSFTSNAGTGMYVPGSNQLGFSVNGTAAIRIQSTGTVLTLPTLIFNAGTTVHEDAVNVLNQVNGTNAQSSRLSFSSTGPVYWMTTARAAGALYTAVGGAAQISYAQTTAPTCSSNCGTSPSISGSDTAMRVTMGATGAPASGWVVTFNGTWPAAPVCIVQSALTTMVVGKMPIAVQTSTTTITVTTNGTAPANADQYEIQCNGVS